MSFSEPTSSELNDHIFGRVPMDPSFYAQTTLPPPATQYQSGSSGSGRMLQMGDDGMDLDQRVRQIGEW